MLYSDQAGLSRFPGDFQISFLVFEPKNKKAGVFFLRKAGIIVIIILFIISGALAVLYQQSVLHTVPNPPDEEISVTPTVPATEKEEPGSIELSFVPAATAKKEDITLIPGRGLRDICSVGSNGSLNFLFGGLCTLEEGGINAWPELMFIWNNGAQAVVSITVKTEDTLPPYLSLQAGLAAETLQFDEGGFSRQSFLLQPGSRLTLGAVLDLREGVKPEAGSHWHFTVFVE